MKGLIMKKAIKVILIVAALLGSISQAAAAGKEKPWSDIGEIDISWSDSSEDDISWPDSSEKTLPERARAANVNLNKGSEMARAFKRGLLENYDLRSFLHGEDSEGFVTDFGVTGDLAPKGLEKRRAERDEEFLSIPKLFVKEMEEVLEMKNLHKFMRDDEFKKTPKEHYKTRIIYRAYINNFEVKGVVIQASFLGNGKLDFVTMRRKGPISDEMVSVIEAGGSISEEAAKNIVMKDMKSGGLAFAERVEIMFVEILAIHEEPYLVWKMDAYKEVVGGDDLDDYEYYYTIDAFTGEIIEKTKNYRKRVPYLGNRGL